MHHLRRAGALVRQLPLFKRMVSQQTSGVLDASGGYVRLDAPFRKSIGDVEHPAATGRYHLYISLACPWANRCYAVLLLKGLSDAIGVSIVHPTWARTRPDSEDDQHAGWVFADSNDAPVSSTLGFGAFDGRGCIPDTVNGAKFIRDLYDMSGGEEGVTRSVPILWDKVTKSIVNNESSEIIIMLNSSFNEWAKRPDLDLNPEDLRAERDSVDEWIYPTINNGVYRCGFAKKQEPYEVAFSELFASLDRCEEILSRQRYIAGDRLTLSDIRLFMTLVRFDEVYVVYFKCNKRSISSYPNLNNYCRELYQIPEIQQSINMYHIKTHYFSSHPILNHYAIIPNGPGVVDDLVKDHDRNRFSGLGFQA